MSNYPETKSSINTNYKNDEFDISFVPKELKEFFVNLQKRYCQQILDKCHDSNPNHKVYFSFLNSDAFEAFSYRDEKDDVILISKGMVLSILGLFNRIFNKDNIIDFSGRSDLEEIFVENGNIFYGLSLAPKRFPSSDTASNLCIWLSIIALDFIFQHELGHVWNGHTQLKTLIHDICDNNNLRWDLPNFQESEYYLDRQTLEMDADGYAIAQILLNLVSDTDRYSFFPKSVKIPDIELEFGDGSTRIFFAVFSIYILFKCLDERFDNRKIETMTHPPSPLRVLLLIGTSSTYFARKEIWTVDKISSFTSKCALAAENVFANLLRRSFDVEDFINLSVKTFVRYRKILLRNWHDLYKILNPLKIGGNLPLPQDSALFD